MGTSLDDVVKGAEKLFGSNAVVRLTDRKVNRIPVLQTGVPNLDIALGVGGLPKGRIIEIYGPEASGKTTLALTVIANAQKNGSWAFYADMEHALDPSWAEKLGVNLDKLLIAQPSYAEECLSMVEYMIETGVIDIVVTDSVASLVPKAELDGEAGESHMGLQARLMSQAMRRLVGKLNRTECIAIFINQIREKFNVMFGSPETTSGGRALKFASSVRIDVRSIGNIGSKDDIEGRNIRFKIVKNKVAPPFKICEAPLLYETGFSISSSLLEAGLSVGIIEKSGNTYTLDEIKLGVGKESATKYIESLSVEKQQELYNKICGVDLKKKSNLKDKIAILEKQLTETQDEEEKKKIQAKLADLKEALEEQNVDKEIGGELLKEE